MADDHERRKVFVVEDDPGTRRVLTRLLERYFDSRTIEFDNGEEALNALDEDVFMVVVDMQLPGIDGVEFVRRVREQGNNIPVVCVSSVSDRGIVEELAGHGVMEYVLKPFQLEGVRKRFAAVYQRIEAAASYQA